MTLPDPNLRWNEQTQQYDMSEIDWTEFFEVLAGRGPLNSERLRARRAGARGRRVGARGRGRVRAQAVARPRRRRRWRDGDSRRLPRTRPGPCGRSSCARTAGLAHVHVGSLHAPDAEMAVRNGRDLYTRRGEGVSIWVVPGRGDHHERSRREGRVLREPGGQELPARGVLQGVGGGAAPVTLRPVGERAEPQGPAEAARRRHRRPAPAGSTS